jgi:hypothetical protein
MTRALDHTYMQSMPNGFTRDAHAAFMQLHMLDPPLQD